MDIFFKLIFNLLYRKLDKHVLITFGALVTRASFNFLKFKTNLHFVLHSRSST